jgi:hypothetical protein
MNPINAINQEFARCLVEEWNDEASIRQQELQDTSSASAFDGVWQQVVGWLRGQASEPLREVEEVAG